MNAPAFAFARPGTAPPEEFGSYAITAQPTKRVGLVPMMADSRHNLPIADGGGRARVESVTCKDRRNYHRASVRIFCMHPHCAGKSWGTVDEMTKAHPPHVEMLNRQETHLFFAWSEDPCNATPEPSCGDCAAATIAASERATAAAKRKDAKAAEVRVDACCTKHAGGPIGLLTPHDPNMAAA